MLTTTQENLLSLILEHAINGTIESDALESLVIGKMSNSDLSNDVNYLEHLGLVKARRFIRGNFILKICPPGQQYFEQKLLEKKQALEIDKIKSKERRRDLRHDFIVAIVGAAVGCVLTLVCQIIWNLI